MSKFKGLFIDDDVENQKTFSRFLNSEYIEMVLMEELPIDYKQIYEKIIDENIDFLIIDFDLGIQVSYNGMNVLEFIREKDKEIYIIYLTNRDFQIKYLSEFDQAINKKSFASEIKEISGRLNRALSRELSIKMEREIENTFKVQQKFLDAQIQILKDLTKKED